MKNLVLILEVAVLMVPAVLAMHFFELDGLELVNELTDGHETTADLDQYAVAALDFDVDATLVESVHSLRFTQEHDLHLLLLRMRVDK